MRTTDLATKELRPGERLLWSGQGDPGVVFSPADLFLIPFSLVWGGFAIFWEYNAVFRSANSSGAAFGKIFGGVFVVIGLYFIVGRFFVKAHRKRTEVYAVTDRRAFVTNGRNTREGSLDNVGRTTTWSRNRQHVSIVWNTNSGGYGGFFGGQRSGIPGNTGMDVIGGPQQLGFYDVSDGSGLVSALDAHQASGRR